MPALLRLSVTLTPKEMRVQSEGQICLNISRYSSFATTVKLFGSIYGPLEQQAFLNLLCKQY